MFDKEECSGDELTEQTDTLMNQTIESLSVAKGKGLLSEDKYDEAVISARSIIETNRRLKCIVDSIPKQTTSPELILEEIK